MQTRKIFVLPAFVRYFGFLLVVAGLILTLIQFVSGAKVSDFFKPDAEIEIFAINAMAILGLALIVFSKEKIEDEYLNYVRVKSFLISVSIHSLYFIIFSFTNYTLSLINFPAIILMNSILIVYIIAFYIQK